MRKKILPLTIISVIGLLLVGCTAGGNSLWDKLQSSETDPNHIQGLPDDALSLLETPVLTTAPLFKTEVEYPEGWSFDRGVTDEFEGQNAPPPEYFEAFGATNADASCTLLANVEFLASYNSGRGDLYLTKSNLYQNLESYSTDGSSEESVFVKNEDGTIQFLTGKYEGESISFYVDEETGELIEDGTVPVKGYLAIRAFDFLMDNPYVFDESYTDQFGSDPRKGLPVIVYRYSCVDVNQSTDEEWVALLNSIEVQVK